MPRLWDSPADTVVHVAMVNHAEVRLSEALTHPGWRAAIDSELESHRVNKTWVEVPRAPPGVHVLPCAWIFDVKSDGRLKARLVAHGHRQRPGEYGEVYAPVAGEASIKAVFALVARRNLAWTQMDVKTAYLNGELQETVYMQPPPGFVESYGGGVVQLKKAIYGLKQAGRVWYSTIRDFLISLKYKQTSRRCLTRACLFAWTVAVDCCRCCSCTSTTCCWRVTNGRT